MDQELGALKLSVQDLLESKQEHIAGPRATFKEGKATQTLLHLEECSAELDLEMHPSPWAYYVTAQ